MLRNSEALAQEYDFQSEVKTTNDTITLTNVIECKPDQMVSLPNNKLAIIQQDFYISIWDIETGKEINNTRTLTKNPELFPLPNGSLIYRKEISPNQVSLFDPAKKLHHEVDDDILITERTKMINQDEFLCNSNHDIDNILLYNINNLHSPSARIKDPARDRVSCSFSGFGQDKLIIGTYSGLVYILQKTQTGFQPLTHFTDKEYYYPIFYGIDNEYFILFNKQSFEPRISIWKFNEANGCQKIKEVIATPDVYHFVPFSTISRAFFTCDDLKYKPIKDVVLWDAENLTPHFIHFEKNIKFIVPASPYQFAVYFQDSQHIAIYQSEFLLKRYQRYLADVKNFVSQEILDSNPIVDPDSTGIIVDYFADDTVELPFMMYKAGFFNQKKTENVAVEKELGWGECRIS